MAHPSIKKSIFWSAVEQIGPQFISFFVSIILARLLIPADYGLIGMLSLFIAFATLFADAGMSQALIQRKNNSIHDETTVFLMNICVGFVLAVFLCSISPLVAWFFKQPALKLLLCAQSLSIIISSFGIVQYALVSREMNFYIAAKVSLISTIASGVTGISLAFWGCGVWALVFAGLAGALSRVIAFWILSDWRPKGKFSQQSLASIWKYSANLLSAGIFTTFVDNLSSVLIGRFYAPASLGVYTRANQLQLLPNSIITGIVQRVSFPYFSKNQDNRIILLTILRKSIRSTLFFSASTSILLALLADPLVPWLLGKNWAAVIPLLRILCIGGIWFPVNVLLITLIKSVGRSDLVLKVEIIKKTIIFSVVFCTSLISVFAMAWGFLLTATAAYAFNAGFALPLINYRWRMQFFDIIPALALSGIAALFAGLASIPFALMAPFYLILVKCATFMLFIFGGLFAFRANFFKDSWSQILWACRHFLSLFLKKSEIAGEPTSFKAENEKISRSSCKTCVFP